MISLIGNDKIFHHENTKIGKHEKNTNFKF
jgi:hypothetical protein